MKRLSWLLSPHTSINKEHSLGAAFSTVLVPPTVFSLLFSHRASAIPAFESRHPGLPTAARSSAHSRSRTSSNTAWLVENIAVKAGSDGGSG